ncbi:dual specificity protein phosphatase 15 isoform X4 [Heterocephalus glaber]|uniref:Dual specificity protein phosphatase 15 isoform X4 n=1 Tax=Heterocephalus glaber TaxID=10181 RepID=A0AAX6SPX1_HETGA|nr:dual specificity protein phosphatase 15 isoform X4 [Heterocephalus glaber]
MTEGYFLDSTLETSLMPKTQISWDGIRSLTSSLSTSRHSLCCSKKHFRECIDFIHSCRLDGGNCLVHCSAGSWKSALARARSATRRTCARCCRCASGVARGQRPQPPRPRRIRPLRRGPCSAWCRARLGTPTGRCRCWRALSRLSPASLGVCPARAASEDPLPPGGPLSGPSFFDQDGPQGVGAPAACPLACPLLVASQSVCRPLCPLCVCVWPACCSHLVP